MRLTFNATFLKSSIFLIEPMLILLVIKKKYKKIRKIKIYKKKKLRDQVGNLAIFLPITTGLHNTHKGRAILHN